MISENLKQIRKDKKISRSELARKSGITARTIENIEYGKNKNPTIDTLKKLANALNVSVTQLLDLD